MASKLKLRATARFLASIFDGLGTVARKDGLATYIDLDWSKFTQTTAYDPTTTQVLIQDSGSGIFSLALLSTVLSVKSVKTITAAGPYTALPADEVLIINQTTGAPFTVNVDWSQRLKPLRVVDGKGDAATNNITVTPAVGQIQLGAVNFSYVIDSNGGSIILTPLPNGSGAY
jgi:hypothetical protein